MHEDFPPAFWDGVAQFNQRAFYECHDTLEAIWMEAMDPERTFYQGILQVSVALYHLSRHNLRGATITLGEGLNRLGRYPADYAGIDLEQLRHQGLTLLTALQTTPDDQVGELVQYLGLTAAGSNQAEAQRLASEDPQAEKMTDRTELPQVPTIQPLADTSLN